MKKGFLKGILFVVAGAVCYAVLATLVRLAYNEGYSTTEVTIAQYSLGLATMGLLVLVNPKAGRKEKIKDDDSYTWLKLMLGGTAYGCTGLFYYLSVKYVPVSICVVLLMQAIWMGILLESLLAGKMPGVGKCIAVVIILAGTLLATNAIGNLQGLDIRGIMWGLGAAAMYTVMLFVSNRIGLNMHPAKKSCWILLGATIVVLAAGALRLPMTFNATVFLKWGLLLSLFGTILPPLLFNIGLPKTGIGLGSILISMEIPVSVSMAYLLLHEKVLFIQWLGILLILFSIVLINLNLVRKEFKKLLPA